jgi:hypothetical protein
MPLSVLLPGFWHTFSAPSQQLWRFWRLCCGIRLFIVSVCIRSTFDLLVSRTRANVVSGRHYLMTNYPYILFNKSPLQLRLIGARGGRAFGRNQRTRRARIALMPTPPEAVPLSDAHTQSTAEAIALLDAQFPWLQCAEKRTSWKRENLGRPHARRSA